MSPPRKSAAPASRWLLLTHQLPEKSAYLRVKIWRSLRAIGAVGLKNSLYVLPAGEQACRDFERILREIDRNGGSGAVLEAELVFGLRDDQVRALFNTARDKDYDALIKELREAGRASAKTRSKADSAAILPKFRQRLAEIEQIDFFEPSSRVTAEALLAEFEHRSITKKKSSAGHRAPLDPASLSSRTWVTRQGIHVDRIACSWLIRRFIDPEAKFKFVIGRTYEVKPGELRYDMQDGEFTHEGEKCSFEVLIERAEIKDAALEAIAEIIHDIDLKDGKFGRPETAGIAHVIAGICRNQGEDEARMARGKELFDDTYEQFRKKHKG
jgi:hypothetical protein